MGVKAYETVEQLPKTVDLAVIATPAKTVPDIVEQCGARRLSFTIMPHLI